MADEYPGSEVISEPLGFFFEETDRPRGIFTQTDRQLLFGELEYDSDQALRNARHRVREHIRHSLNDIFLINRNLDDSELKQVIDRQKEIDVENELTQIAYDPALIELGIRIARIQYEENDRYTFEDVIEEMVVRRTLNVASSMSDDMFIKNVEVEVNIEQEDVTGKKVIYDLIHGKPSVGELMDFLSKGDPERLRDRLRELDTELETADSQKISPEDTIFDLYSSDDSNSG
jgi:hypothetical protein